MSERDGKEELEAIWKFALENPSGGFHTLDLPYRLSSPAAQNPENRRLWKKRDGELVAAAVLQRQFSTIDLFIRSDELALRREMMEWAELRLQKFADVESRTFGFLADSRNSNDQLLGQLGWELQDWHIKQLRLDSHEPEIVSSLPDNVKIRPLDPASEAGDYAELHRSAFNTRNMSADWRSSTLDHPAYRNEIDLVAEDERGSLVGFCIGWTARIGDEIAGQIEPVGVLPEFHRMGVGKAILMQNITTMNDLGITPLWIDCESNNPASNALYTSVGFRPHSLVHKYYRRFESA